MGRATDLLDVSRATQRKTLERPGRRLADHPAPSPESLLTLAGSRDDNIGDKPPTTHL